MPTENEALLDPEVREDSLNELDAISAGHGPLYDDIEADLGRFSMAATRIEDTRIQAERDRANLYLVGDFVKLLPQGNDGFRLRGLNSQSVARQIQANTLWANEPGNHYATGSRYPYFVVGRYDGTSASDNVTSLLLANGRNVYMIDVNKNDMRFRDQLAEEIQNEEFNDYEIGKMLDKETGELVLHSFIYGSTELGSNKGFRSSSSLERVEDNGVRRIEHGNNWYSKMDLSVGIPSDLMEQFHVSTTMAMLAVAFGLEEELRELLGQSPDKESETDEATPRA